MSERSSRFVSSRGPSRGVARGAPPGIRWATARVAIAIALLAAGGLSLPRDAEAQVGLAVRVGTTGVGPEAAVGVGDRLVLRAGASVSTRDVQTTFDGVAVRLDMPRTWYHAGLDYHVDSAFRLGFGVIVRPDDIEIAGAFDRPVDLGGQTLTRDQIGSLAGIIATAHEAPYALIGFGRHVTPGVGLSLDVGAAYFGSSTTTLEASGGTLGSSELRPLLDDEAEDFQDDMKTYVRVWPILSLSLKIGFGRAPADP